MLPDMTHPPAGPEQQHLSKDPGWAHTILGHLNDP